MSQQEAEGTTDYRIEIKMASANSWEIRLYVTWHCLLGCCQFFVQAGVRLERSNVKYDKHTRQVIVICV